MCPLCISTLGWIIAGGASAGAGALGALIALPRKKGRDHDEDHHQDT